MGEEKKERNLDSNITSIGKRLRGRRKGRKFNKERQTVGQSTLVFFYSSHVVYISLGYNKFQVFFRQLP